MELKIAKDRRNVFRMKCLKPATVLQFVLKILHFKIYIYYKLDYSCLCISVMLV